MAKWAHSLIRLSKYEVESLQKGMAQIVSQRTAAELRCATLDAEREIERERAMGDPLMGMHWMAYVKGWEARKGQALHELDLLAEIEVKAREKLSDAYAELKKFEHVAEAAKVKQQKKMDAIEAAQMDEAALRKSSNHGPGSL